MAGIGQSSLSQSDQSSVWTNQYNMGRSVMNTDNVSGLTNKLLMDTRRMMDENSMVNQQMMQGRQQTGFQTALMGSDGSGSGSAMNKQPFMNNPMSSGLPGGFTTRNTAPMNYMPPSNSSVNSMDPMMMSSHRSSGNLMSSMYNGAPGAMSGQTSQQSMKRNMILDQQIWETPIGNFDNNEFPVLNKVKSGPNLSHMTLSRQTQFQAQGMVNYQNVLKSSGSGLIGSNYDGTSIIGSGHHQHHQNQTGPSQEFSIQQEDFPALPVAQNPSTQSGSTSSAGNAIGSSNVASTASSAFEQHNQQQQQILQQSQSQLQQQQQQRSSSLLITPDPTTGNRSFAHTLSSRQLPPVDHSSASDIGSHHNLLGVQRSVYGGNGSSPLTIDSTATNADFSPYNNHQQSHHHIPQSMMGASSLVSHSSQQQTASGINIASSNNSSQQQANLLKQHYQQIQHHPLQNHPLPLQTMQHRNYQFQQQFKQKKVIQIPDSNYIAYIPSDMVTDAFGLIGLIKLINVNSSYENLKSLAPGFDMIAELNPELSTSKDIYPSFVTPLTSRPSGRPHDMDFVGPREYRIRDKIREKLSDPYPERLADETLFWIFYNLVGEECQLIAARTLMQRQWRFHNKLATWITRDPKSQTEVFHTGERGTFITWDYERCIKVPKQMEISMKDLETMSEFSAFGKAIFPFLGKKQIGIGNNNGSTVVPTPSSSSSNLMMMPSGQTTQIIRPQILPHPTVPSIIGGIQNLHNPSQSTNIIGVSNTNNSTAILSKTPTNANNSTSQIPGPSLITNSNSINTTSLIAPTSTIITSCNEVSTPSSSNVTIAGSSIQRGSGGGPVNMNAVQQSKNLTSASLSSNVINNQISSSTQ